MPDTNFNPKLAKVTLGYLKPELAYMGANKGSFTTVASMPTNNSVNDVASLSVVDGDNHAGVYMWDGTRWVFFLAFDALAVENLQTQVDKNTPTVEFVKSVLKEDTSNAPDGTPFIHTVVSQINQLLTGIDKNGGLWLFDSVLRLMSHPLYAMTITDAVGALLAGFTHTGGLQLGALGIETTTSGWLFTITAKNPQGETVVLFGIRPDGKVVCDLAGLPQGGGSDVEFPVDTYFKVGVDGWLFVITGKNANDDEVVLLGVNAKGKLVCDLDSPPAVAVEIPYEPPTTLLWQAQLRFLVFVYLCHIYGQSLSYGTRSTPPLSTTQPFNNLMPNGGVRSANNALFTSLVPLVEALDGDPVTGRGETPVSGCVNTLSYRLREMGINPQLLGRTDGNGGQSVAQLSKGTSNYTRMLNTVIDGSNVVGTTGKKLASLFVTWIQGEQDASLNTPYGTYLQSLQQFYKDYTTDVCKITGQDFLPAFVISQCTNYASYGRTLPVWALAQWELARENASVIMSGAGYHFEKSSDLLHLSSQGTLALGIQMALAVAHMLETGTPFLPLHCYKVTFGTAYSDLHFYVPTGVLVKDTSVVTQKVLFGRNTDGITICNNAGVPVDLQTQVPEYLPDGRTIRIHHAGGAIPVGHMIRVGANDPVETNDGPTIVSAGGTNIRDSLAFPYNDKVGGIAYSRNYAILTSHTNLGVNP